MAKRLLNGRKEDVERAREGRGKGKRRLLKTAKRTKEDPKSMA